MAKRRLSNDAIRYIVECRNDSSNVYTWQEIADLVKDKFNIDVSLQAAAQNYRKYKDSFSSITEKSKTEKVKLNTLTTVKDIKPTVNSTKSDILKSDNGFNENAGEQLTKDDLKDLL